MMTMQKEHLEVREAPPDQPPRESTEQSPTVIAALESLTDKQQEVIRLKFQGGLSYQEIAEVMEITANHVGVLIHTALKTIREKLHCSELNSPGMRARTFR